MRGSRLLFFLGLFFLLIGRLFLPVQAKEYIWKIGKFDSNSQGSEFSWPPEIVSLDYLVPPNWEDNPAWEFPQLLWSSSDSYAEDRIQEICLNFPYNADYQNPVLEVQAKPSDPNATLFLEIMKFDTKIFVGQTPMYKDDRYFSYPFPIGLIKGGEVDEKNEIIIRCWHQKEESEKTRYIIFDALSLSYDETESDLDGAWDRDEEDAGSDSRTATIMKVGRNPADKKIFTLKIQEPEGTNPYFQKVRFIDPNELAGIERIKSRYYFPYGFLGFHLDAVEAGGQVTIQVTYKDTHKPENKFFSSLCCYNYQDTNTWQEMDFVFLDGNSINIKVTDGENGDRDGSINGASDTIFALSYPQNLFVTVNSKGCFLQSICSKLINEK